MSKMIVWIIAGIVAYIAMPILIMVTVVAIWYWCTAYIANSILKEDEDGDGTAIFSKLSPLGAGACDTFVADDEFLSVFIDSQ